MTIQEIMSALKTIRTMFDLLDDKTDEDRRKKLGLYNAYQALAEKADSMGASPEIW